MLAIRVALRESLSNTPDHGHRVLVSPTVGLIFFARIFDAARAVERVGVAAWVGDGP